MGVRPCLLMRMAGTVMLREESIMPPTMLIDALQGIRRRVKLLGVCYGVGTAVAVAVALRLRTILFDYLLSLPAWPRLVLMLGAAACVAYVIARWIFIPARSTLSLSDV